MPPSGWICASTQRFKKYLFHALATDRKGTLVFAKDESVRAPIGYVATIEYPFSFWGKIIMRHPFSSGLSIVPYIVKKLRGILAHKRQIKSGGNSKIFLPRFRWTKNNERTARVLFIGVLERYRGQAVGMRLYNAVTKELSKKGCIVLEAHIDKGNDASVKLHTRAGFSLTECAGGEFLARIRVNHKNSLP